MSFNIVCLKWGDKYSSDYVNKLYSMVERHLTLPHRFVCLTDDKTGIDPRVECKELLDENLEGWWNKLSLFKEKIHDLEGTVVFLDLDVVIVDNIDFLFEYRPDEKMIGVCDPIFPDVEYNSSVLRFEIGEWQEIYNRFRTELHLQPDGHYRHPHKVFIGDQQWITYCAYPDGTHKHHTYKEGKVVSFKRHVQHSGNPQPGQAIILFHGRPNPHELNLQWIRENWR